MSTRDKQIEILRDLYSIKGDGVATLDLNALKNNDAFKKAISALSDLEIKTENNQNHNTTPHTA